MSIHSAHHAGRKQGREDGVFRTSTGEGINLLLFFSPYGWANLYLRSSLTTLQATLFSLVILANTRFLYCFSIPLVRANTCFITDIFRCKGKACRCGQVPVSYYC